MSAIECVGCGEQVNEETRWCPACGADPRTGEPGPEPASGGRPQPRELDEVCAHCGHGLASSGTVKLRTGGTTGGWIFLFDQWAQLDEGVLPLELVVCAGCRRVEFRVPEALH